MKSIRTCIGCLLLAALFATTTQAQTDRSAARLIDAFIDLRHNATPESTKTLLEDLKKIGVSEMSALEEAVRATRATFTSKAGIRGKTTTHDVECLHVDYKSRYFMFVPKDIDLAEPISLIVVGHGGNSSMSAKRAESTAKIPSTPTEFTSRANRWAGTWRFARL